MPTQQQELMESVGGGRAAEVLGLPYLWGKLLSLDSVEKPLEAPQRLLLLAAEWLCQFVPPLDALTCGACLDQAAPYVRKAGEQLAQGSKTRFSLHLNDFRFLACAGQSGFYDLLHWRSVEQLPYPSVTYVSCDLSAAYFLAQQQAPA